MEALGSFFLLESQQRDARAGGDTLHREPELLALPPVRARGAEPVQPKHVPVASPPTSTSSSLPPPRPPDADAHRGRQHLVAVLLRLRFEQLHARHRHHPHACPSPRGSAAPRARAKPRRRSRSGSARAAPPGGVRQHVAAPARPRRRAELVGAVEGRDSCRESSSATGHPRVSVMRHASTVSLASAGRITTGWGSRAGRRVLDRLVRRAVLAEPHAVVRPHPDDRQLRQRGEAYRCGACSPRTSGRSSRTA